MSGFRPFTRQLGAQPGVQLNPLADQTDGVVPDNSDQVGATIARLTRGRIDQPFPTTKGNLVQKTGKAEALRVNALNESKLSAYEGLGKGMSACVVQRMVSENARKLYAVVRLNGATSETADIVDYSVSEQAPTANYSMYLMHHDCFNDGIRILVHADATPVGGTPEPNPVITLRVTDPTGILLHQFTGSLDKNAVLYETYNGGTKVVFTDCLTAAKSLVSFRRLQNVAEMAASIDNAIALAAKEYSQRPMASFIKEMSDFMTKLFEGAQASEWLVPSEGLPGNAAFAFEVAPSEAKPADTVMVNYYTSYDGVARQVFLQQTLVK